MGSPEAITEAGFFMNTSGRSGGPAAAPLDAAASISAAWSR